MKKRTKAGRQVGMLDRRAVLRGAAGAAGLLAGGWLGGGGASSPVAAAELLEGTLVSDLGEVVYDLALTPDAMAVIAATISPEAYVVQLSDGATIAELRGHSDDVNGVAVSPDGMLFATGSDDTTVRIWRRDNLSARVLRGHRNGVYAVAFSPDSTLLASGGEDNVRLWRVSDGMPVGMIPTDARRLAFTPDGGTVAVGGFAGLGLWRVADRTKVRDLDGERTVALSPNGQLLAAQEAGGYAVGLWRVADGAKVRTLKGHRNSVDSIAFTPNGQTLITGSDDNSTRVWNVNDGKLLFVAIDDQLGAGGVVALPDSKTFITGGGEMYRYMLP